MNIYPVWLRAVVTYNGRVMLNGKVIGRIDKLSRFVHFDDDSKRKELFEQLERRSDRFLITE